MNFCPDCETYLITKIGQSLDNPNKILSYHCNNCSYSKVVDISKEPEYKCVYHNNLVNTKKIKINQKNIQYISNDPTLPHVNNIQCPNSECLTNKKNPASEILTETNKLDASDTPNTVAASSISKNDVLYIKLNESDLTFLYQCCNCKYTWTNK
uniref:DNA-directed RNA polymerase M/15kDa subunit domain-containing protein n=1 Tax=viral metagenome TaxID=1070528 RepID=A0A6C0HMZ8_9ZZZZ